MIPQNKIEKGEKKREKVGENEFSLQLHNYIPDSTVSS